MDEIIIYRDSNREVNFEVRLKEETVWLNQFQISALFQTNRTVITKHLGNIFSSGELDEGSNVQKMHIPNSDKPVKFYNLDAIISVGYRVNSKNATQFRIWATKVLKEHLVNGYTINSKRLLEVKGKFEELQKTISFLQEKSRRGLLVGQAAEILSLLSNYAKTLTLLDEYDKGKLKETAGRKTKFALKYEDALTIIARIKQELIFKKEAGDLFGLERGKAFESIAKNLYQTFGGHELYLSLEDKASHLLYLIIKDHPFSDGNKRIASFMFVYFLNKCGYLCKKSGEVKINDNALVALALLIAESEPKEKGVMIKIIKNLLKE